MLVDRLLDLGLFGFVGQFGFFYFFNFFDFINRFGAFGSVGLLSFVGKPVKLRRLLRHYNGIGRLGCGQQGCLLLSA